MNGDLKILAPGAGTLQRLEAAGNLFEAVVEAITATDRGEAIEDMGQVLGRQLVHGEVAIIDPPLHIVGADHLAGLVDIGFVILLQGRLERRKVAAIGIGDHDLLGIRQGAAIAVAQRDLHLIAPPLVHLEGGGTRGGRWTGPHLLAIQQHLGTLADIAVPEIPGDGHIGAILHLDQLVISGRGLADFNDGKLGGAPTDGGFAGSRRISGGGGEQGADHHGQQCRFWT